ncbi:ABC transporter ATP-binding protein [Novispirillum itersonii]|uniref:ABC transporter ATP-binding protein n=1 Tax=Novispirillum itersonii TaxID=189 RepID=UPI000363ED7F|nr:ABC transporter ATP-binding protein [Novispirillum itersonii]
MTDLLVLNGLQKHFGALRATDDVSLSVRPGTLHALIGPNGAGKSTLIGQIAGTITPDRGSITFRGEDVTPLTLPQRARKGLGRTFQISSLIPEFSALRNVMLAVQARQGSSFRFWGRVMADRSLTGPAMACLERVGLADRARVPVSDLSHGERRQLELAVALALEPVLLLLDEPMAGLGPEESRKMTDLLHTLKRETAMLLVEHDMDAVFSLADEVSVLVYGRVIANGPVAEIRTSAAVREAYLGEDA